MEGYVSMHRKLCESKLWQEEPFTKGQAWADLILLANHKDGCILKRGIKVEVKRGQVGWSKEKLAKRWGWSRGKMYRFLAFLSEQKMIQLTEQKNLSINVAISIVNYDKYQMKEMEQNSKRNSKRNTNNNSSSSRTTKKEKIYKKEKDFVFQNGQLERWEKFTTWADKQNFDLIARLDPITPQQLFTLAENYGSKAVVDILLAMENHKPITKNKSIYLTASNWLRRNEEKNV